MTVPPPGAPRPPEPGPPAGSRDAIAAAMAELDGLEERPLAEHVAVFERIHAALGDALAEAPDGPAGA